MSDLATILQAMGEGVKAVRDRALLLVGFAGAFRRSELVALDRVDLEFVRQGLVVYPASFNGDKQGVGSAKENGREGPCAGPGKSRLYGDQQ